MEKERFLLIAYVSNYGGIETLMIRMVKWMRENGHASMILTDSERPLDRELARQLEQDTEIQRIPFRGFYPGQAADVLGDYAVEGMKIIVFSYPAYLLADDIRRKTPECQIIFYDPHQYGLILEFAVRGRLMKQAAHWWGKSLAKRMDRQNELVYMDGLCMDRTSRIYGCASRPDLVIPLAMELRGYNRRQAQERYRQREFRILTITRMEFPFKGYVIGLVGLFEQLRRRYPSLHLDVVGDGSCGRQLKNRLGHLDPEIRRRVHWHGSVPYGELDAYFRKAKLYIGMGTTVLDAANHGIVSLPVGSYTYHCKGYGFLHQDPMNLGGIGGRTEMEGLIRQVLAFSEEEYCHCVRRQFAAIHPLYDMDRVMNRFCLWENTRTASILHRWERGLIAMGRWAWRMRHGIAGRKGSAKERGKWGTGQLFKAARLAGLTAMGIPVRIAGKLRAWGWLRDENTEALRRYENCHAKERCVLVANGPSLRPEDLERIKNEWTFGCNKIYHMFPKTNWRPDFYCVLDERYIQRSQDEIFSRIDVPVFTNDAVYRQIQSKYRGNRTILYSKQIHYTSFKAWPHLLQYTYGTNQGTVLSFVMALAIYMGFQEIYVLGADNTGGAVGNHFAGHEEDRGLEAIQKARMEQNGWTADHWQKQMEREMEAFAAYAKDHGITIRNVTRGGQLEAFERADFDAVFP